MICAQRDQDLLLFAHHELGPVRRALTSLHLRRCPRCQERSARLSHISDVLADTLRPRSQPPRAWRQGTPALRQPSSMTGVWIVAVLLASLTAAALVSAVRHVRAPVVSQRLSVPCRPDLPSDRCR